MSKTVRVALAGAGRFGALHLRVFADLPVEVVAVCDPDAERRGRFGVPDYPDLDSLLAEHCVDLVDVCSDEDSHGALVLRALDSGAHVLVEKPLATTLAEAEAIKAKASQRGLAVIAAQLSRFGAGYQQLHQLLGHGEFGRLAALRFRRDFSRSWFPAFGERVHPVWESGIHDIDLAVWFAGAPCVEIQSSSRNIAGLSKPDLMVAVLRFANGVLATVESAWLVPEAAPQTLRGALELEGTIEATMEVLGDQGTAAYRLANDGLSARTGSGIVQPELTLWPSVAGKVSGALAAELDYATSVVAGRRENDLVPLEQAVEGVRIAEAIAENGDGLIRMEAA